MAMNHVVMTEWRRLDDGSREGHAELAVDRKYVLREGEAHVYNEGVIHSLDRPLETRLVRVTGCDLDRTLRYRLRPGEECREGSRTAYGLKRFRPEWNPGEIADGAASLDTAPARLLGMRGGFWVGHHPPSS